MPDKMSFWKLLMLACTLHCVLCQELQHISEEELNGNDKFLNMSARGLVETLDLNSFSAWESVDYSNNAIVNLDWNRFTSAPNLKAIDLSGNPDLALPEHGPEIELPISVLNMTNCNVRIIQKNSLNGLSSLDVLDLRGNPISFEESTVFEDLATPPALLIVSQINKNELKHVCKNVDMKIQIIDDDMTRECKNVRLNSPGQPRSSPNREKIYREVEGDDLLMSAGTHLEMQADEANDGEEDDEGTQPPPEDPTDFDAGTQSPEADEGTQPPSEDFTEDDEGTQPHPEADTEDGEYTQPPEDVPEPPKINDNLQTSIAPNAIEGTQSAPERDIADDEDTQRPVDATELPKTEPSNGTVASHDDEQAIIEAALPVDNLQTQIAPIVVEGSQSVPGRDIADDEDTQRPVDAPEHPKPKPRIIAPNPIEGSHDDEQGMIEAAPPVGKTSEVTNPASSSKSIILILIVAACIIGTAFGLMKYYKDRRNNRSASSSEEQSENMKEMRECKPLMYETLPDDEKPNGGSDCPDVVVDGAARVDEQMSTKDMIMGLGNLPDIDDPNRLSTIIVSSTNLSPSAK